MPEIEISVAEVWCTISPGIARQYHTSYTPLAASQRPGIVIRLVPHPHFLLDRVRTSPITSESAEGNCCGIDGFRKRRTEALLPCLQGCFSPTIREDFFSHPLKIVPSSPTFPCVSQARSAAIVVVGSGRKTGNSRCNAIRCS